MIISVSAAVKRCSLRLLIQNPNHRHRRSCYHRIIHNNYTPRTTFPSLHRPALPALLSFSTPRRHYHNSTNNSNENSLTSMSSPAVAIADTTRTSCSRDSDDSDATLKSMMRSSASKTTRYSIYDLDSQSIQNITNIDDLEDLVEQVEQMSTLLIHDIGPLIIPITRLTSMKKYKERGALLTERLLVTCLSRLPHDITQRTHEHPYPTVAMYNRAIIAWGNVQQPERAQAVFDLQLHEYIREQQSNYSSSTSSNYIRAPPPDRKCYKSLIRAWAVAKQPAKAYQLLQQAEILSGVPALLNEPPPSTKIINNLPPIILDTLPDLGTYNVVINSYAKSPVLNKPIALQRVNALIQRLQQLQEATTTTTSYNNVHDDYDNYNINNNNNRYKFDGHTYIGWLMAYQRYIAAIPAPIPSQYTHDILNIIKQIHHDIDERLMSSDNNHEHGHNNNRYMSISTQIKRELDENDAYDNKRNEYFLFPLSMSWVYDIAIHALTKTHPKGQYGPIADEIFLTLTYSNNNHLYSSSSFDDDNNTLFYIPDKVAQVTNLNNNTLIQLVHFWEGSGLPDSKERIQRIIDCVVTNGVDRQLRVYEINQIMEGWYQTKWKHAPAIIERMLFYAWEQWEIKNNNNNSKKNSSNSNKHRSKPNGQTFEIAMRAWLQSNNDDDAPYRIELLLQRMLYQYEQMNDTWMRPNEVHIRYLLSSWIGRTGTGRKYDGISGKDMYPSEHCESLIYWLNGKDWFGRQKMNIAGQYASALRAWALQVIPSDDLDPPNPVEQSVKILHDLDEFLPVNNKLLPAFPCNWVLQCCCKPQPTLEKKLESYRVAIETFQRSNQNARSFVLMVQVLRTQVQPELDDEHINVVIDLFHKCCSCGMLTQDMIRQVLNVLRADTIQKLFGISYNFAQMIIEQREQNRLEELFSSKLPNQLSIDNLPVEWSINADRQRNNQKKTINSK